MSVAFRRESDEEHLEPRFELPIPPGPNLVTSRGLALIVSRIAELTDLLAVADEEARVAEISRDLRYWRARKASARPTPATPGEEAGFGSRIRYTDGDRALSIDIVGQDEADPASGRIAFSSPLARKLIGAAAGDSIEAGKGRGTIEIIEVTPIPE